MPNPPFTDNSFVADRSSGVRRRLRPPGSMPVMTAQRTTSFGGVVQALHRACPVLVVPGGRPEGLLRPLSELHVDVPLQSQLAQEGDETNRSRDEKAPHRRAVHLVTRNGLLFDEAPKLIGLARNISERSVVVNAKDPYKPVILLCDARLLPRSEVPEQVLRERRQSFLAAQVRNAEHINHRAATRIVLSSVKSAATAIGVSLAELTGNRAGAEAYARSTLDDIVDDVRATGAMERADENWWRITRNGTLTISQRLAEIDGEEVQVFEGGLRSLCDQKPTMCSDCPKITTEERVDRTDAELRRSMADRKAGMEQLFEMLDEPGSPLRPVKLLLPSTDPPSLDCAESLDRDFRCRDVA
jgi:hypothetical protein